MRCIETSWAPQYKDYQISLTTVFFTQTSLFLTKVMVRFVKWKRSHNSDIYLHRITVQYNGIRRKPQKTVAFAMLTYSTPYVKSKESNLFHQNNECLLQTANQQDLISRDNVPKALVFEQCLALFCIQLLHSHPFLMLWDMNFISICAEVKSVRDSANQSVPRVFSVHRKTALDIFIINK